MPQYVGLVIVATGPAVSRRCLDIPQQPVNDDGSMSPSGKIFTNSVRRLHVEGLK